MKIVLSALALASIVHAHWYMDQVLVNGRSQGAGMKYIRKNSNGYNPAFPDIMSTPEYRCNKGATNNGARTQTLTVKAGDTVGFRMFNRENVEHPGPSSLWMSRAPSSVASYDGSGGWFKIWEAGLCGGNASRDANWCTWHKTDIAAKIPATTPPGEYLLRVESIGLHGASKPNGAQLYINCAQIKVVGGGGGTPAPLVKIPGYLAANSRSIVYDKWKGNPAPYVMPGPKAWTG